MVRLRVRVLPPDILHGALAAGIGFSLLASACTEKKTPPAPTQPTRTIIGLNVRGCAQDQGLQCRAYLAYNTREEEDVSTRTEWYSFRNEVATVDGTGKVTVHLGGAVKIRGRVRDDKAMTEGTQEIFPVMPAVDIRGTVRTRTGLPIAGAELTVVGGLSRGTTTTTNAQGAWTLNLYPEYQHAVRVYRLGYDQKTFDIYLSNGGLTKQHDLELYASGTTPAPPPPTPPTPAPPKVQDPINFEFTGSLSDGFGSRDPWCVEARFNGREKRCQTFTIPASPHRQIDAELTWWRLGGASDMDTVLGIEIVDGSYLVTYTDGSAGGAARTPSREVGGNKAYTIRVLMHEGPGPVEFRLKVNRRGLY
jgi:hypothetical protein